MMWAHYCDNQKGVALEIDLYILFSENTTLLNRSKFGNIKYNNQSKPWIDWSQTLSVEENIKNIVLNNVQKFFLSKSKCWEHENEFRLLMIENENRYLSIKNSLTGIYLGLFMPYSYRPSIDHYIDDKQTKIYDLDYNENEITAVERKKGDFRQFINRKFYDDNN